MAVRPNWGRANARDCATRAQRAGNPFAKAAHRELVRAWLMLADSAEQLQAAKPISPARSATTHAEAA
jgi:hypothetical protein